MIIRTRRARRQRYVFSDRQRYIEFNPVRAGIPRIRTSVADQAFAHMWRLATSQISTNVDVTMRISVSFIANRYFIAALAASMLIIYGWHERFDPDSVVGKYALLNIYGTDTIELNHGGTYIHILQTKNGREVQQNGTWTLEDLQSGPTISLNHFRSFSENDNQENVIYLLHVKKSLGHIYLITNIDLDEGYEKIQG